MDYINEFKNMNIFARPVDGLAVPDGNPVPIRADSYGGLMVSPLMPDYLELARRGRLFVARSSAAAAIPINTTCTNAPTLWNVAGSNKIVVPLIISMSFATLGTPVIDGFVLMWAEGMGAQVGTGAPFPTFTNIPPRCTLLGGMLGTSNTTRFANGTVTWTTQPAALLDLGMGQYVSGTAASGENYRGMFFDLKGAVVMAPGTAVCVAAATAASSGTYWTSILFAELPMVPGVET